MMKRIVSTILSAAMLCGTAAFAAPAGTAEAVPYRTMVTATILEVKTSMHEGDITIVPSIVVKTDDYEKLEVKLAENTYYIDAKDGLVTWKSDVTKQPEQLKVGDKILLTYGAVASASEPAQVTAEAVVVNSGAGTTPNLLDAERVTRNSDGSVTLMANNGTIAVTVGKDTPITPFRTRNVVTNADIHMGTRLFAFYDVMTLSMPGQATATKVVLLPNEERSFTILTGGDIAVGEGKVEHGVAMVPLRKVAETLGYTVTWNGQDESVHLTNGTRQTTVRLGEDTYFYASAIEGMDGMTAPVSFGAAAYEVDGTSWAPAELFTLLGHKTLALTGSVMHLTGVTEGSTEVPNPMEPSTAADLAALGLALNVPDKAADVKYFLIDGKLAQASFKLDGKTYTYRASESEEDNSGVWSPIEKTDKIAVGDVNVFIKTIVDNGGFVAVWNRAGVQYSLSLLEKGEVSAFTVLATDLAK